MKIECRPKRVSDVLKRVVNNQSRRVGGRDVFKVTEEEPSLADFICAISILDREEFNKITIEEDKL